MSHEPTSHVEFEHALINFGLVARKHHAEHTQAAAAATAKKKADEECGHHGISAENRARVMAEHDRVIGDHADKADAWQKRGAAADGGFFLHRQAEARDGDYMREYQPMLHAAYRHGRVITEPLAEPLEGEPVRGE